LIDSCQSSLLTCASIDSIDCTAVCAFDGVNSFDGATLCGFVDNIVRGTIVYGFEAFMTALCVASMAPLYEISTTSTALPAVANGPNPC
jgi:hypothetical protein